MHGTCVREVHCQQDSVWASIHIFFSFKRARNLLEALIKIGWIKTRLGIVVLDAASFIVHKMVRMSICGHGDWVWALLGHLVGIHPHSLLPCCQEQTVPPVTIFKERICKATKQNKWKIKYTSKAQNSSHILRLLLTFGSCSLPSPAALLCKGMGRVCLLLHFECV